MFEKIESVKWLQSVIFQLFPFQLFPYPLIYKMSSPVSNVVIDADVPAVAAVVEHVELEKPKVHVKKHEIFPGFNVYSCKYRWYVCDTEGNEVNYKDIAIMENIWIRRNHRIDKFRINLYISLMVYEDVLQTKANMETQTCFIAAESRFADMTFKVPLVTETGQNLTLVFEPQY